MVWLTFSNKSLIVIVLFLIMHIIYINVYFDNAYATYVDHVNK